MRVNIYNEELTDRVEFTETKAKTGATFFGLRFFLRSPEQLHNSPNDDDQSAVVFWSDPREKLLSLLSKGIDEIRKSEVEGQSEQTPESPEDFRGSREA